MSDLSVTVLGSFSAETNGCFLQKFRTNKVQALLIYLTTEATTPIAREKLMDLIWPDLPRESAQINLRQTVYQLRKLLIDARGEEAEPFILSERLTIGINPEVDCMVDAHEFRQLIDTVNRHPHPDLYSCPDCQSLLEKAIVLYRGDFLDDFYLVDSNSFEEWAMVKRETMRRRALDALETLTAMRLRQHAWHEAQQLARRQIEIDNLREIGHRQLMEGLARNGQSGEALSQYEAYGQLLAEEMGMAPTARTTLLYEQIKSGSLESTPAQSGGIHGYELLEEIGAGAFGTVHRAYQPAVEREVAIKVILPEYANRPDFVRRFETEARTVARLEHPHIVPLYDYWREPDGAYLVMRLLRGGSLEEALQAGAVSLETAVSITDQIAAALDVAHRAGVVHRDLKPANILLDETGNAYLSDFGIAKDLTDDSQLTAVGAIIGSPAYLSPEQVLNEQITPATDIYSFGIILYALLTGEKPFGDANLATLIHKHLNEPLPLIHERKADIPPLVDAVIQRATAKKANGRYPDALAVAAAFREAIYRAKSGAAFAAPIELPPANLPNPYKGLRPFQENDSANFFGRHALIQGLIGRLSSDRFLAVVGPSGSGKSSVVKAGLIPAVRRGEISNSENWFVVEMTPGTHPLEDLEAALLHIAVNPPPSLIEPLQKDERGLIRTVKRILPRDQESDQPSELLLLIDQFEELFTLTADEAMRTHFIDSLVTAVSDPRSRLRIIVTLRADFYDRPLQYAGLGELLRQHTELILPLNAAELEQTISGPAQQVGVTAEPSLIAAIVADVNEQPGALPLLQYALTELYERRDGRLLTQSAYEAIGGVAGALSRRAEELYQELDENGREAARQLFLRLVTLGEGVEDTRRRVLQSELTALNAPIDKVLTVYGRYRLLSFDRDPLTREATVEVAHEALLREWPRLRGWLDESRDDIRIQRLLSHAAAEWIGADQEESFLLGGSRLQQFADWSETATVSLTEQEQTFLNASLAARLAQQTEETARLAQKTALEQRSRRVSWALAAVFAVAALIAGGLSLVAFQQRQSALEAYSMSLIAHAQNALNDDDSATALALALAANRADMPLEAVERTLLEAAYAPGARERFTIDTIFEGIDGVPLSVAIAPDGQTVLVGLSDGMAGLWNLTTGTEIHRLDDRLNGHTGGVNDVEFSPDGQTAVSGANDGQVIVWDVATGEENNRFTAHSGAVRTVAFSPDGKLILSGGFAGNTTLNPGELILWDAATGEEIRRFEGSREMVADAVFTPDGSRVIASSGEVDYTLDPATSGKENQEYQLLIWDTTSGELIYRSDDLPRHVTAVSISPDGRTLLAASADHNVHLLNAETGEEIAVLEAHPDLVKTAVFSPNGRKIISAGGDGGLVLWDAAKADALAHFAVHTDDVNAIAFLPDGDAALSASSDGALILWALSNAAEIDRFEGHTASVLDVAFHPNGTDLLSASGGADPAEGVVDDISLRLWDMGSGAELNALTGHDHSIFQFAIAPDGKTALTASIDGSVRLWDMATGAEISRFDAHYAPVFSVAFTPDGQHAFSGAIDGSVLLWEVDSGEIIHRFDDRQNGHQGGIWGAAVSPDGQSALTVADDSTMIQWDLTSGKEIDRWIAPEANGATGVAFSPNGRRAVYSDSGGMLVEWDLETGAELNRIYAHTGTGSAGRTRTAYLPDGKQLLSSGWDGSLALWDLETGALIRRFTGHEADFIFDIAVSENGRFALSGATDRTMIQWQLDTPTEGQLLEWIKENRYVRDLTCAERENYRIEPLCDGG